MATKKAAKKAAKKTAKKTAKTKSPKGKTTEKAPAKKGEAAADKSEKKAAPAPATPSVELIGLEQLAELLKLTAAQVRQMLRTGRIRGVKVDGEWRFNPKLVQQTLGRRSRGR